VDQSGSDGEEECPCPCRELNPTRPARSLVATLTTAAHSMDIQLRA